MSTDNKQRQFYLDEVTPLYDDIYRIAFDAFNDRHTAQETTQIVFEKAWKHIGGLRDKNKVSPWLKTIARNEIINQMNHRKHNLFVSFPDNHEDIALEEELKFIEYDILDAIIRKEEAALVLEALSRLDDASQYITGFMFCVK